MEIKTTQEIRNSLTPKVTEQIAKKYWVKRWIAVDDLIKWINEYNDVGAFNEYQIRKRTLIKLLQDSASRNSGGKNE